MPRDLRWWNAGRKSVWSSETFITTEIFNEKRERQSSGDGAEETLEVTLSGRWTEGQTTLGLEEEKSLNVKDSQIWKVRRIPEQRRNEDH